MRDLALVNGKRVPLRRARVPLLDRGFLLADGVYEVLRSYDGEIFQLSSHLRRLTASLRGVRISLPLPPARLAAQLRLLLRHSGHRDARLYVQVTRGVARRTQAFPPGVRPTLVAAVEAVPPLPAGLRQRGVAVHTVPDPRWQRCDLKTIALLPNVLAKQAALDAGVYEAIFLGPGGVVREASTANVFMVRGGVLRTHPLGPAILAGVSRGVVLSLARAAGLRVVERPFRLATLLAADEVFLSSTMQEILPVVRVDGRRIGGGRPGPIVHELYARFQARTRGVAGPALRAPEAANRKRRRGPRPRR